MKILYHHRTTARDGSAVHIEGLIDALRGLGADVLLVAPSAASKEGGGSRLSSIRRRLPRVIHELLEIAYNLPETTRLLKAVWGFRPDVIYERSNLFLLSGTVVARFTGTRLIAEVNAPLALERGRHGGLALHWLAHWFEGVAWRGADRVVAVTEVLKNIVASSGVPADHVVVMANGIESSSVGDEVDPEATRARLGITGRVVLGFTGFVRDWNGLDKIIELIAMPGRHDLHLLVVGDGPARRDLEEQAQRSSVADRVTFTGVVPRKEVPSFVAAFDIALLPAVNPYASPLKALEYMALGRAIVAPDQSNIHELLDDGRTALLFDPASTPSLYATIERLAVDHEMRLKLGRSAREALVMRDLSWRRNATRVLAMGTELLRGDTGLNRASANDK